MVLVSASCRGIHGEHGQGRHNHPSIPCGGLCELCSVLQAAVLDESVAQVVIRVSETDADAFDDDGANVSLYPTSWASTIARATIGPFQLGT